MLDAYDRPVPDVDQVLNPATILALRARAAGTHVAPEIKDYVVSLVGATRDHPRIRLGASPRAALGLMRAAKARAFWAGREFVLPDDLRALARPVLGHRLLLTPEAELEGHAGVEVVDEVLRAVPYRGPGSR